MSLHDPCVRVQQCISFVFRNLPNRPISEPDQSDFPGKAAQRRLWHESDPKSVKNGRKWLEKQFSRLRIFEIHRKVGKKGTKLIDQPIDRKNKCTGVTILCIAEKCSSDLRQDQYGHSCFGQQNTQNTLDSLCRHVSTVATSTVWITIPQAPMNFATRATQHQGTKLRPCILLQDATL